MSLFYCSAALKPSKVLRKVVLHTLMACISVFEHYNKMYGSYRGYYCISLQNIYFFKHWKSRDQTCVRCLYRRYVVCCLNILKTTQSTTVSVIVYGVLQQHCLSVIPPSIPRVFGVYGNHSYVGMFHCLQNVYFTRSKDFCI